MFKRVVNHPGFWKSVTVLTLVYTLLLFLLQWGFMGFSARYFKMAPVSYFVFIISGFTAGFFMSYGKFWGKLKQEAHKK
ncbi:MAG: hypothetical protein ACPG7E_08765 [Marinirhabdus sp.]